MVNDDLRAALRSVLVRVECGEISSLITANELVSFGYLDRQRPGGSGSPELREWLDGASPPRQCVEKPQKSQVAKVSAYDLYGQATAILSEGH